MDVSEFWSLVEQARDEASGGGGWPSGAVVGQALAARLAQEPVERIVRFHRCFEGVVARAHRWELCAAAYVIWGYISDDAFGDFKAGLVGLGREAFEQAVADADALAGQPVVQAIATGRIDRFALAAEAVQFAASQAFEQCCGDAEAFWEALAAGPGDIGDAAELPPGVPWSGRFGSLEGLARIPHRLPRLLALFPERTG